MAPELLSLAPGVQYLPGAVNSVVVEDGRGGALVVDTGLDESHARKLLRAMEAKGLTPGAILNTHSHADHVGGNAFLVKRFPDLKVFAPPLEDAIIRSPVLEPIYLFGARPPRALQNKFLMAAPSPARLAPEPGLTRLAGVEVELIEVAGHASLMFAVRVGEVLYAADALFGPAALARHPLTFCMDSALQKESAAKLAALEGVRVTLPGHGDSTDDLGALVQVNLDAYARTTEVVREAVRTPGTVDEVLRRVTLALGLEVREAGAALLNRSVVSAHLVELLERDEAALEVQDGVPVFHARPAP